MGLRQGTDLNSSIVLRIPEAKPPEKKKYIRALFAKGASLNPCRSSGFL